MRRVLLPVILATLLALLPGLALANTGINAKVNAFRTAHGLRALHTSDNLDHLAVIRSHQIVTRFTHDFWWLNYTACESGGEVIAWRSPPLPKAKRAWWFVNAWKESALHRAILLGSAWRRIGSAIYVTNHTMYGVALFCDPR